MAMNVFLLNYKITSKLLNYKHCYKVIHCEKQDRYDKYDITSLIHNAY